ncbi:LOW QUALITY PROTEIN: b(0,+)-type amino acid transporter 1-like [Rhopilema esculentum]|uniref:LOW QUALITY PROTEIN: b(0,+)-type amino acid transporter 1-like n=1 Tax=Rhopilema esculentum TaxID=499914 RepID=UPI0031D92F55
MAVLNNTESTALLASQKSEHLPGSRESINAIQLNVKELARSLGFWHAFAYVVGILFGSGIYISPSLVARETNNMAIALVVWIVSGIIPILGALSLCELACAIGKAGGEYIFNKEAFGDIAAFVTLWAKVVVGFPAAIAVLGMAISEYILSPFIDITALNGVWITKAVSVLFIAVSAIINSLSASFVGKTQVFFTAIQSLSVLFFVSLGIWKASTGHTQNYVTIFDNSSKFELGSFGIAIYNGLWAYDGWGYICTITEELKNPKRDIRLAILFGVGFVILCYLLINLTLLTVSVYAVCDKDSRQKCRIFVPFAAAFSCFSALNGINFVSSRLVLSASREGHLPEPLSYIHMDRRTPIPAVLFQSTLSTIWILVLGGGTQSLVIYYSFAIWFTYGLAIFGVIVLRVRQPDLPRPFKVWIINPIFMTLVSLLLLVFPFLKRPVECSLSLVFVFVAVPIYFLVVQERNCTPDWLRSWKDKLYLCILLRCNLVKCVFVASKTTVKNCQVDSTSL